MSVSVEDLLADEPVGTDFKRDHNKRPLIVPPDGGKAIGYTRSSSAAKTIDDTFNLEMYARRNVAYGMAYDRSLVAKVIALGGTPREWGSEEKQAVNQIAEAAQQVAKAHEAADVGTAVHRLSERHDLGEVVDAGLYQDDIDAYASKLHEHGIVTVADLVECRIVCDELGMAGTADRIVNLVPDAPLRRHLRLADDEMLIADLKTGEGVEYGALGWAAQLAAYARGCLYDPVGDVRLPTPKINRRWGLIIHLPAGQGRCDLYVIDLEAGYRAALLANEIRSIRAQAKGWLTPVAETPALPTHPEDLVAVLEESLAESAGGPAVSAELVQSTSLQLRARLNAAVAAGARTIAWPSGVARFVEGGPTTWLQVLLVERAVVAAEGEAQVEWHAPLPTDPNVVPEPERRFVADVVDIVPRQPSIDGDDLAAIKAMHDALPLDLQAASFGAVVAAGLPTDRRLWRSGHAEALRSILESATAEHGRRKALVASTLQHFDASDDRLLIPILVAVEPPLDDTDEPSLDLELLTHDQAERLVAIVDALDAGSIAMAWDNGAASLATCQATEPALLAALSTKAAVVAAAKEAAVIHGRPKPRSCADAAADPVLTALLLAGTSSNQAQGATP